MVASGPAVLRLLPLRYVRYRTDRPRLFEYAGLEVSRQEGPCQEILFLFVHLEIQP